MPVLTRESTEKLIEGGKWMRVWDRYLLRPLPTSTVAENNQLLTLKVATIAQQVFKAEVEPRLGKRISSHLPLL